MLCKVLEKLICTRLQAVVDNNGGLSQSQCGLTKAKSTLDAVDNWSAKKQTSSKDRDGIAAQKMTASLSRWMLKTHLTQPGGTKYWMRCQRSASHFTFRSRCGSVFSIASIFEPSDPFALIKAVKAPSAQMRVTEIPKAVAKDASMRLIGLHALMSARVSKVFVPFSRSTRAVGIRLKRREHCSWRC